MHYPAHLAKLLAMQPPGAGPAPGQQMPGYAPMKKPSLRYAPGMYTEPERSPAPMGVVDQRMPPKRAIPFDRMQMNRSY